MGSGDRITYGTEYNVFGIGVALSTHPFALTVNLHLFFWWLSIGFGKAYDK